MTIDDKKQFLLKHNIALWDVIKKCTIVGSQDTSIDNVEINDIQKIIKLSKVKCIYLNGDKAYQLYNKYIYPIINIEGIKLPSTSPLNASWSLDKLCEAWKVIL